MTDSLLERLRALRWEPSPDAVKAVVALDADCDDEDAETARLVLQTGNAVDADQLKAEVLRAVAAECDRRVSYDHADIFSQGVRAGVGDLATHLEETADALAPATEPPK